MTMLQQIQQLKVHAQQLSIVGQMWLKYYRDRVS
jgi:hypothetical protein